MSHQVEFGDFQTSRDLADRVCERLKEAGLYPTSVIEPTCGLGNFIESARKSFSTAREFRGFEIDPDYVNRARQRFADDNSVEIIERDVMQEGLFPASTIPENCLILGNPPWTTNSTMGCINGVNLPEKSNIHGLQGLDALTGKSNFDISEWMLMHFTKLLVGTDGYLAMLVKTSVARKIINHLFKSKTNLRHISLHKIDAMAEFNVSVDACLLVVCFSATKAGALRSCKIYNSLEQKAPASVIGWRRGKLVSNPDTFDRLSDRYLACSKPENPWRSGMKHDCSRVFELKRQGNSLMNGYGELVDVEEKFLFPLMKGTDLALTKDISRWVICPQREVGENTERLKILAPKLWAYLESYSKELAARRSRIYMNKPNFSVFGIGLYSFQPWKIAISGLHKSYGFRLVEPYENKPVLFDDTCYQISFADKAKAKRVFKKIMSQPCIEFLESMTFWDNKRPITAEILNLLCIDGSSQPHFNLPMGESQSV